MMIGFRVLTLSVAVSILLAVSSLALAPAVWAMDPRGGNIVVVGKDEVIDDDVYLAGQNLRVDGKVNGDVVAAGSNIEINGTVTGSVMAAGGTISVRGEVGHSARIAGGSLVVEGKIKRDLLAAGGSLELRQGAEVGQDLAFGVGTANLAGQITRTLSGGAGQAVISGTVGGNARIETDNLTISDGARIEGNLEYEGAAEGAIAPGAIIGGQTIYTVRKESPEASQGWQAGDIVRKVVTLLMLFVAGLFIVLVFPQHSREVAEAVQQRTWLTLGWGALVLLVTPFALGVVLITVVGIPLAIVGFALYILGLYLSQVFIGLFLGRAIWKALSWPDTRWWALLQLLTGLIILAVLANLPWVGFLVGLAIAVFGLGAMWLSLIWRPMVEEPAQAALFASARD
ncbi:MAG: hypothetical protein ABIH46_07215 [Chloroflexota bacterium]